MLWSGAIPIEQGGLTDHRGQIGQLGFVPADAGGDRLGQDGGAAFSNREFRWCGGHDGKEVGGDGGLS